MCLCDMSVFRTPGAMTDVGLYLLPAIFRLIGDLTCGTLCCFSSRLSCFCCRDPGLWAPEDESPARPRTFIAAATVVPEPEPAAAPSATVVVDVEEAAGPTPAAIKSVASLRRTSSQVQKRFDDR